jgi:NTE family protein
MNILKQIKRIAGSTAGAFVATAMAVGYQPDEIRLIFAETDFNQFKDSGPATFPFFKKVQNILFSFGWYRGDILYRWLGNLIKNKTGKADITFLEIYNRYGIELVLTGTNLNKAMTCYFHHRSYPDMPVRLAARISGSLPLVYVPVRFQGDLFIDGGFLNNYPIWVFDKHDEICNTPSCDPTPKTLGIKLMEKNTYRDEMLFHGRLDTSRFHNYCLSLMDCMMYQIEKAHIKKGYWERTISVQTSDIKTTEFGISKKEKDLLYQTGYEAVEEYFISSKYYEQLYYQYKLRKKSDYKTKFNNLIKVKKRVRKHTKIPT